MITRRYLVKFLGRPLKIWWSIWREKHLLIKGRLGLKICIHLHIVKMEYDVHGNINSYNKAGNFINNCVLIICYVLYIGSWKHWSVGGVCELGPTLQGYIKGERYGAEVIRLVKWQRSAEQQSVKKNNIKSCNQKKDSSSLPTGMRHLCTYLSLFVIKLIYKLKLNSFQSLTKEETIKKQSSNTGKSSVLSKIVTNP